MIVFHVIAEPLEGRGPRAAAYVVADHRDEAIVLMRKDVDFSGYRLPPAQLLECRADTDDVRRKLGPTAAHEKGVFGFAVIDPPNEPTTPAAVQAQG